MKCLVDIKEQLFFICIGLLWLLIGTIYQKCSLRYDSALNIWYMAVIPYKSDRCTIDSSLDEDWSNRTYVNQQDVCFNSWSTYIEIRNTEQ